MIRIIGGNSSMRTDATLPKADRPEPRQQNPQRTPWRKPTLRAIDAAQAELGVNANSDGGITTS